MRPRVIPAEDPQAERTRRPPRLASMRPRVIPAEDSLPEQLLREFIGRLQ